MFTNIKSENKMQRYSMAAKHYFEKLDLRMGKIVEVISSTFKGEASYTLTVDFGDLIGKKTTILRITKAYRPEHLKDKYVIGIVNFPLERVEDHNIEVFLLGMPDFNDREIFLTSDEHIPVGEKVYLVE